MVEVTGGSVGLVVGLGVAGGGSFGSFVAVAWIVGDAVGDPVGDPVGEGVVVAGDGVADGDGEGETAVGLVGVALGFNTTKGTTFASVACGVRNESAHDIGVRISRRTGATEPGNLFESR
jgi:hypothetical protein